MGIPNQHKVHKKLEMYDDRITDLENTILHILKVFGIVFTVLFFITWFIDPIRQRPWEMEWLQIIACSLFSILSVMCFMLRKLVGDERRGW